MVGDGLNDAATWAALACGFDRHDNLTVARATTGAAFSNIRVGWVMLCDRARILARSDQPETMP